MKRFNATIHLVPELDENFWKLIPAHRLHIGKLMNEDIIETYAINVNRSKGWITINAENKKKAMSIVQAFPIFDYLRVEMDELFIFDNALNALPKLIMN